MKEITSYQTNDGTIFQSKEEAIRYELFYQFKEWYFNHQFPISSESCDISKLIFDWIYTNKNDLQPIFFPNTNEINMDTWKKELEKSKQTDWPYVPNPINPISPSPFHYDKIWCFNTNYKIE